MEIIYISIIDGRGSLEAVKADRLHGNCFRLLQSSEDPEHYDWEYSAGDVVHCREVVFAPGEWGYLAVERCPHQGG